MEPAKYEVVLKMTDLQAYVLWFEFFEKARPWICLPNLSFTKSIVSDFHNLYLSLSAL